MILWYIDALVASLENFFLIRVNRKNGWIHSWRICETIKSHSHLRLYFCPVVKNDNQLLCWRFLTVSTRFQASLLNTEKQVIAGSYYSLRKLSIRNYHHMESSQLVCIADKLSFLCMIGILTVNGFGWGILLKHLRFQWKKLTMEAAK